MEISGSTEASMSSTERRHEIVQLAIGSGRVRVTDLAERFSVSEVTIRNDLKLLESRGVLSRTHGGALASNRMIRELSLIEKSIEHIGVKRRLAEAACQFISSGDSIIVDSGSTTGEIAKLLSKFERLTVMTNGLNVATAVSCIENIQLMMTGGVLRHKSQSFFGRHAEEGLDRYNFDTLFLGADGIDFRAGVTTHFEREALLNKRMCEVAHKVIAVVDSSKFNRSSLHKICGLDELDVVITDRGIQDNFAGALEKYGVHLVIVDAQ